jgi:Domain of unknown function (DUF4396)
MEAAAHAQHEHHAMPTEGRALTGVAVSATLHCLTGCAIGEVAGVAIGTALGFSDFQTIALAVALAFLFGYALTSLPLLRAGLAVSAVISIALASDTLSIATMEIVDNAILLIIPGAMDAGLSDVLFWGSLAFALVIAGAVAMPVNRALIARGKGHAAVHETGIHGGPPVRLVGIVTAVAFVFGTSVLIAEAIGSDESEHGGDQMAAAASEESMSAEHGAEAGGEAAAAADPVRGLAISENGMTLELGQTTLERGRAANFSFRVTDESGQPVRDYDVEHTKQMHLIVVRRDTAGFQHLHPTMDESGTWSTAITILDAGSYRVFADFSSGGENTTLAADLAVDGPTDWQAMPEQTETVGAGDGYEVSVAGDGSTAGQASELDFTVSRDGEPVQVQPYLGADGHLVALREGDMAFLHTHPEEHADGSDAIRFTTEYPSAGRYRLFLQFKHGGKVHTAAFTREVSR